VAYGGGYSMRGEDPDYRRESVYHFGNALNLFAQEIQQRQSQQQLLAQNEAQRFFREAQLDPSLADTWGPDMVRRIGTQVPEAQYLVQAIQQRSQQAQQIRGGWDAFVAASDQAKGHIADLQTAANLLPDSYNVPSQFPESQGLPAAVPNLDKQALLQKIQGIQAVGVPRTAMNSLTTQQEANARLYVESLDPKGDHGLAAMLPAPMTGFDLRKLGEGPQQKMALYAMLNNLDPNQMGSWGPEAQQAARQFLQLDPTGAEVKKLETQAQNNTALAGLKQQYEIANMNQRFLNSMALNKYSHDRVAGQETVNNSRRVNLLASEGKILGIGDPAMVAVSAANANIKDWGQQFQQLKATQGPGSDPNKLLNAWQGRPAPLPPGAGDSIADALSAEVGMGALDPGRVPSEAAQLGLDVQRLLKTPVWNSAQPPDAMSPKPYSLADALKVALSTAHRNLMPQIIAGMPDPQGKNAQNLMQNPDYANLVNQGYSPHQARSVLMNKAYDRVFTQTGDPMAALSAATGQPIPPPQVRTKIRARLRSTVPGGGALPMGSMANFPSVQAPPDQTGESLNSSPPQDVGPPPEF
jgi:hypothetical protein